MDVSSYYAQAERYLTTWIEALRAPSPDWASLVKQWSLVEGLLRAREDSGAELVARAAGRLREWAALGAQAPKASSDRGRVAAHELGKKGTISLQMQCLLEEIRQERRKGGAP